MIFYLFIIKISSLSQTTGLLTSGYHLKMFVSTLHFPAACPKVPNRAATRTGIHPVYMKRIEDPLLSFLKSRKLQQGRKARVVT